MEKTLITKFIIEYLNLMSTTTNKPSAEEALNHLLDFLYSMESKLAEQVKSMVGCIFDTERGK